MSNSLPTSHGYTSESAKLIEQFNGKSKDMKVIETLLKFVYCYSFSVRSQHMALITYSMKTFRCETIMSRDICTTMIRRDICITMISRDICTTHYICTYMDICTSREVTMPLSRSQNFSVGTTSRLGQLSSASKLF